MITSQSGKTSETAMGLLLFFSKTNKQTNVSGISKGGFKIITGLTAWWLFCGKLGNFDRDFYLFPSNLSSIIGKLLGVLKFVKKKQKFTFVLTRMSHWDEISFLRATWIIKHAFSTELLRGSSEKRHFPVACKFLTRILCKCNTGIPGSSSVQWYDKQCECG